MCPCDEADVSTVPEAKLTALARYGMSAKAGALEDLSADRRTGTLLATVRHLDTTSVDDALDLFDVLMATKLLARAERASVADRLRTLPKFRRAAKTLSAAVQVLLETPSADGPGERPQVSVDEVWSEIEKVTARDQLSSAVELVHSLVSDEDDDDEGWRAELVRRYATVRPFLQLLTEVITFGATEAGSAVVAAVHTLPSLIGRQKVRVDETDASLVTGSWRRLVYANPDCPPDALGPDGDAITQTYLAEMVAPRREAFSAKIREAQAHGQIDPTLDPELMQELLAGALIHRLLLWGDLATDTDPKAYIEAVLEAVGFPRRRGQEPRGKRSGRRG